MEPTFIHLHLHSEYSLVDSVIRLKNLIKQVAAHDMPAVAITDQSNLFAMVKFYRMAQANGIKPIIGVDAWLKNENEPDKPFRIVFLCQNKTGYLNLTRLISKSYLQGQHRGMPMLEYQWLSQYSEGLIAIANARDSDIARAILSDNQTAADKLLAFWQQHFANAFYLELCLTGRAQESVYFDMAVNYAIARKVPVVASNDVRFLAAADYEAHEVRVCICEGRVLEDNRRQRNYSEQQYLRSADEMARLFADVPQALANTVEIAKRCNLTLELDNNYLPQFPVPAGMKEAEFLREESLKGLEKRFNQFKAQKYSLTKTQVSEYRERLDLELGVIEQMGFPGYFLIVSDFIRWAKKNQIPVGPGRGSGAGSLVAYALEITDLDPLRYELLFERFLNPERVSMPDFDVDFCMDRRDDVIDYVAEHYGRDKVAQIITYGTMAAKAVVRDVGRVLSHPYGFVDRIAKLIPFEIGMTLTKALEQEEALRELYEQDDEIQTLIDMAKSLEGLVRNAGKHAGGVVIAPSELTDFSPLYCEPDASSVVTQFDKNDVEAVGLVKFDFLGLRTLTIIDWTVQSINQKLKADSKNAQLDISMIPVDDTSVFDLLKRCQTTAVFQLESRGMKDLIKRLQPDNFDEIIALVALFRPGPLQSGMVDDFIDRKHGRAEVVYPHPALEPILNPTYGVILYQEQVMQIAQVLAGYTLGGADLLRRAMGKKKPEEMAKQRSIFVEGSGNNKVDKKLASSIFDLMEKFAGYGFNKSHSAAYALVSYQTAWLKTHYPADFMAAVLSSDMDNTDKIVTLIEECRDMQLPVLPPDVNYSGLRFIVAEDGKSIRYGLGAIKGVGQAAIEIMLENRKKCGPFANLFDFCQRMDTRKVNRRVMESLIKAGAMDSLHESRAELMGNLSSAVKAADQHHKNLNSGHVDLFGESDSDSAVISLPMKVFKEWTEETRLTAEKDTLGLYLTGHPITRYETELGFIVSGRIAQLIQEPSAQGSATGESERPAMPSGERHVLVAGLLIAMRVINTRRGRMAIMTLDDRTARIDVTLFNDIFEAQQQNLAKDKVYIVSGKLGPDTFTGGYRVTAEAIYTIEDARTHFGKGLVIRLDQDQGVKGAISNLATILSPFKNGRCPVWVSYQGDNARAQIPLGNEWQVIPSDELLLQLRELAGDRSVWMEYADKSAS